MLREMETSKLLVVMSMVLVVVLCALAIIYMSQHTSSGTADFSEIERANSKLEKFKVYFLGWVVHYSPTSTSTYYKHHDKFTWVSPTWYEVDWNGNVIEVHYNEEFVRKSREWGVKILPLVANRAFDRETVHRILSTPDLRRKVVKQLIEIVLKREYDGINIDFENIPPEDRAYLTEFMREFYETFKQYGKIVSIDVAAKTSETCTGWSGAYDYGGLAKYCDLFIIMIYDYHYSGGSPGPISPLEWFERVLDYALSKVPREKIVAGIPFYGYDWPVGGRGKGVTYSQAIRLAELYGAKVRFDWESGEATFSYVVSGVRHEVWFNIAKSTELRIKLALRKGVNKIAAWRVGQEDPLTWTVIARP
ncbi:MAG: hypothetical protein DRJ51_06680 [Thermoprotei archaeon]|nr:MAG: hypothetical protein DRJ51_06680 [Thermoprotei archaeon]